MASRSILGRVRLFFAALLLNIDSELLRFLVKVAPLQTERLSGIRDVVIATLQLGGNHFTLELLHPLGQRPGARSRRRYGGWSRRKCSANCLWRYLGFGCEQ